MARRMGTATKQSWALAHIHIAYVDACLEEAYGNAITAEDQHELACAGSVNLMAYLGWLRSGELFDGDRQDLTLTQPLDGPTRGLPPGVGAVEYNLSDETKSDPCQTVDVIMAWETLSGLGVGRWLERLLTFEPHDGRRMTLILPLRNKLVNIGRTDGEVRSTDKTNRRRRQL